MNVKVKALENLSIVVVKSDDGRVGAFSKTEPVFFLTDTDEELLRVRVETVVTDYARSFLGGDANVSVKITNEEAPIKVRPVGRMTAELAFA